MVENAVRQSANRCISREKNATSSPSILPHLCYCLAHEPLLFLAALRWLPNAAQSGVQITSRQSAYYLLKENGPVLQ
jgi:hypothetical protein